jgi:hypothetical protein
VYLLPDKTTNMQTRVRMPLDGYWGGQEIPYSVESEGLYPLWNHFRPIHISPSSEIHFDNKGIFPYLQCISFVWEFSAQMLHAFLLSPCVLHIPPTQSFLSSSF